MKHKITCWHCPRCLQPVFRNRYGWFEHFNDKFNCESQNGVWLEPE